MGPPRLAPLALTLVAALLLGLAVADPVPALRRSGVLYVACAPLARALGDILTPGQGSLTWSSDRGVLTVFEGSPDALWKPPGGGAERDLGLSAPALLQGGHWWLPADALDTLGVRLEGETAVLPDGTRLALAVPAPVSNGGDGRSEVDDLGHGVPALRLFPVGGDGRTVVAAEITDLDLLALVEPQQSRTIDGALERTGSDKPLLVVVTALTASAWQPVFVVTQGDHSLELRYPYRMRLVQGSVQRVAPDAPAAVVLLLPESFDLYRPIAVTWQGVTASVTFRR